MVWVNEWFNPPKETEAATALINGGADVLMQNTDSPAVLKTAQRRWQARLRLGQRHDGLRPEGAPGLGGHQLGAVLRQGRRADALEGKWATGKAWWGVEGRRDRLRVGRPPTCRPSSKDRWKRSRPACMTAHFADLEGPGSSTTPAATVLEKDKVADDEWLGGIKFFVKGQSKAR